MRSGVDTKYPDYVIPTLVLTVYESLKKLDIAGRIHWTLGLFFLMSLPAFD